MVVVGERMWSEKRILLKNPYSVFHVVVGWREPQPSRLSPELTRRSITTVLNSILCVQVNLRLWATPLFFFFFS